MPDPLAAPEDVEVIVGVTFDTDQTVRASALLDMASSKIRRACNQTLTLVTDDEVTLSGAYTSMLFLPEIPVVSVASVLLDGTALVYGTGSGVNDGYSWTPFGSLTRLGDRWPIGVDNVVVTYTHGFATVPDDIRTACAELAAAMFQNPLGVNSETVDGYSVSYADAVKDALTAVQPYGVVPVA